MDPRNFLNPFLAARSEKRAHVAFRGGDPVVQLRHALQPDLRAMLYRSSPKNDRLVCLTAAKVAEYLDEIERKSKATDGLPTSLIGCAIS
jgi:hypothetical protein